MEEFSFSSRARGCCVASTSSFGQKTLDEAGGGDRGREGELWKGRGRSEGRKGEAPR